MKGTFWSFAFGFAFFTVCVLPVRAEYVQVKLDDKTIAVDGEHYTVTGLNYLAEYAYDCAPADQKQVFRQMSREQQYAVVSIVRGWLFFSNRDHDKIFKVEGVSAETPIENAAAIFFTEAISQVLQSRKVNEMVPDVFWSYIK